MRLNKWLTTANIISVLLLVGLLLFFRSLFNGFVMDDQGLIINNQNVHSITNLFNFFRGSIFDYGGNLGGVYYRPVMTTVFSFVYTFFGSAPFFYHFLQSGLHIANAILVFLFFKSKVSRITAGCIALIFLIHPIQVESVVYIAALQEILFFFFGMIFLLFLEKKKVPDKKFFIPYIFLLASILSKESGVLFLPVAWVQLYVLKSKKLLTHLIYSGGVLAIYAFLRFFVAKIPVGKTEEFTMMRLPLEERLIHIPTLLFYYLKAFFWPVEIVSVQSWTVSGVTFEEFFLPLIIFILFMAGVLGLLYWVDKKFYNTWLIVLPVWFLIGLALHIQLFPLDLTVADRWFYFPIVGVLGIVGVVVEKVFEVSKVSKVYKVEVVICTIFIIIILALSVRSFVRIGDWQSSKTLAIHDLKIQPKNYQLLSSLGAVYLEEKKYDKAIEYLTPSVALHPHWGTSQYNLAVAYHMSGRLPQAKHFYLEAIKVAPQYINAYENMSILLYYNKETKEAHEYTKKALEKFPGSIKLWQVRALSAKRLDLVEEASRAAQMVYILSTPR